jgi:uncharacterized protein (TIGR03435 family)
MGEISGVAIPFEMFLRALSMRVNRPIEDKTSLHGFFDIKVQWKQDINPGVSDATDDTGSGPSLFTALQEQLGLRLSTAKGPVTVIVVDAIEQPVAN